MIAVTTYPIMSLFIKLNCAVETVPNEPAPVLQSKPVWGLPKPHHVNNYQVKLNELLYKFLPTDEMLLDHESLCLKQEFITEFHDSIITAFHLAMQQSIPYSHQSKGKVIPGWDIDMDIARDKSMFWHGIWKDCGKMPSGVVYSIIKKTRSTYHYMLRALKKKKHYKTKISLSKSMLRSNNGTYWRSARVLRKNNFNRTNIVDDVNGDIQIANLFKDRYERLFNSVQCSKEESELMKTQIDSEVANGCNTTKICESSNCVHCHLISSTDVSTAVSKPKTGKVNDNGMIYSNNFIHGTELLFQYLGLLYTSMVYHGYCPPSFICANSIPIPKGSKANLSDSDKYRSMAISSLLGKILDHIIIEKQSEALKTCNYQFGFKAKSSTVPCSTMVNETVQYYTENGGKPIYVLLLDASKAFDKVAFSVLFQ